MPLSLVLGVAVSYLFHRLGNRFHKTKKPSGQCQDLGWVVRWATWV